MKKSGVSLLIIALVTGLVSCEEAAKNHLPSWNESGKKAAIMQFVDQVTDSTHAKFIPVTDRIAVFDNDGTLWSEKPTYVQAQFALDRLRKISEEKGKDSIPESLQFILDLPANTIPDLNIDQVFDLVFATHAKVTVRQFTNIVKKWLATARHPTKNKPYTELIFKPMLELIDYLKKNDFQVYIVSGGGVDFMRAWTANTYGIPSEKVIGSRLKSAFIQRGDSTEVMKLAEIEFIDDGIGKPENIQKIIGKRPVFCAGNSDGDLAMMQYTASNKRPNLQVYVHHTDAEREWAYDRKSSVGKFDKGLDEARAKNWILVDMKNDWKTIYPSTID